MHLLRHVLLLSCALIHGITEATFADSTRAELIFEKVGNWFYAIGKAWPRHVDTNCDGVLDYGEVLNSTANYLGQDPVHMQNEWDQLEVKNKDFKICYGHGPKSSFIIYALSAAYMHLGRIDRRPCIMIRRMVRAGELYGFNIEQNIQKAITPAVIQPFFEQFHTLAARMEENLFQKQLDLNADGCLSEEEWKSYMQVVEQQVEGFYGFRPGIPTEFSTIEDFRPPRDVGGVAFSSIIQDFYADSCVTQFRFTFWTLFSLFNIFEKANEPALCYKEGNQTNVPLEQSEQRKVEASDQQQGSMESVIILVGIFGGPGIVCLGICIIWCHCKHRRKDNLDLRQKLAMMGTEIEAWSVFDRTLTARTSSLKPSFVQVLGLGNFKEDQLSLTQIVHPEDHSILHATLTQSNSEPITKELRFQYGVSCVMTLDGVELQDDVKYISAQTTMVSSSESRIHVGLGSLSRVGSDNSWGTSLGEPVLENQEAHIQDEEQGNHETLETSEVVTETVFNTADLRHIACLGVEEHWAIYAENITFDTTTVKTGGFGKVQHGILLGSTEVAVKMALTDEKGEQLASKCKVLANEVRLFRRIRHPNVVQFHGVVFTGRPEVIQLGIVLEWVNGGNLGQHCKSQHSTGAYDISTLKTAEGQSIFMSDCGLLLDVVRGMLYLHALRPAILHRDLKPANVLVDKVCVPPRAKLTDFGISILIEHEEHAEKRAGTEAYMAPEVKIGQPYSTMVDVFSFGCVIAFALTGHSLKNNLDPLVLPEDLLELKDAHSFAHPCLIIKYCLDSLVSAACQCLNHDPMLRPKFVDLFTLLSKHLHNGRSKASL